MHRVAQNLIGIYVVIIIFVFSLSIVLLFGKIFGEIVRSILIFLIIASFTIFYIFREYLVELFDKIEVLCNRIFSMEGEHSLAEKEERISSD